MAIAFKGYQHPKDVILHAGFFYVRYGVRPNKGNGMDGSFPAASNAP
jgi:hypothetical protein